MRRSRFLLTYGMSVLLALVGACQSRQTGTPPSPASLASPAVPASWYEPSRALGQLFHDVQMARVFPDGKTFVDARPRSAPASIVARYAAARGVAGFDLRAFVMEHFEPPKPYGGGYESDRARDMEEHIRALWPVLTRVRDVADDRSSLRSE